MINNYEKVSKELKEFILSKDYILAAWEGGSAATGFFDEFSDLDLCMSCEDDRVEEIFTAVTGFLDSNYGIETSFRIPEPSRGGYSQIFYKLKNSGEFFYLDIAVFKKSMKDKYTSSDRHGKALIWIDKENIIDPTPLPEEEHISRGKNLYNLAVSSSFLYIHETKKALARNNFTESWFNLSRFIETKLAVMYNLKYRPEKSDFGIRYAERSYPAEEVQFIQDVLKVSSVEDVKNSFEKVVLKFNSLAEELAPEWK